MNMDAKETIKYLYENGHIIGREHYKTIYDELTSLSIQSKSRFNDWLLAKAEIKQLQADKKELKGLLEVAICPNAMNGCKDGILINPYGEQEPCQWCEMTKQALKEPK